MAYKDKTVRRKFKHANYLQHRERRGIRMKEIREERYKFIIEAKNKPCADCGVHYPHYVMEFDHVRGEKFDNLSRMRRSYGLVRIQEEIDKCDVVCSNCHAARTYKRLFPDGR